MLTLPHISLCCLPCLLRGDTSERPLLPTQEPERSLGQRLPPSPDILECPDPDMVSYGNPKERTGSLQWATAQEQIRRDCPKCKRLTCHLL